MEYRKFGSSIVARMDKGEEILAQIKAIALQEHIRLASVTALARPMTLPWACIR